MNIVFFGTPDWAVRSLEALVRSRHVVRGIVTTPDAPAGRSRQPVPSPVKVAAEALGLAPVLQPPTLRGAAQRDPILALEADAFAVVAYGRLLPGRMLDAPRHGALNVHFSLLPRHRGASPVQHTILCGDAEAGVSTMRMDRGLDTGPVLLQRAEPPGARDTTLTLGARLAELGAALLLATLDGLEAGELAPRAQDHARATFAPPLSKAAGLVDWTESAAALDRRVRAFDPWPPVLCSGPRGALRLVEVEPLAERAPATARPGQVLRRTGEAVDVAAGAGSVLRVMTVQPAGGKPMSAAAALAGRHLALGMLLGDGLAG